MAYFLNPPFAGQVKLNPGTHRFFAELVTAQTAVSALCYRNVTALPADGSSLNISTVCHNFDYEVVIDARPLFAALLDGEDPQFLKIDFRYTPNNPSRIRYTNFTNQYQKIFSSIFYQSFISYYETNKSKIVNKHGRNSKKWPEVLRFSRVIRNTFAHGGKINIHSRDEPSVKWGDLSYSFTDNGRQVLYSDLTNGDVIILMIDMDYCF